MKTKLILKEDDNQVEEIPEEKLVELNITSFVTDLIKNKWEQVDNINGILVTTPKDNFELIDTLKSIIDDEYVHIGQLEKIIQGINPEAVALDSEDVEIK
jgi:hypothetical protein